MSLCNVVPNITLYILKEEWWRWFNRYCISIIICFIVVYCPSWWPANYTILINLYLAEIYCTEYINIYMNILDYEATRIISSTRPLSICLQYLNTNLKYSLYSNSFYLYTITMFAFKVQINRAHQDLKYKKKISFICRKWNIVSHCWQIPGKWFVGA